MAGTPQRLNSAQDLNLQNASIVGSNWAFDPRAFYKVNDIVVESNILYQCILAVEEQDGFFGTDNPPPSSTPTHWAPISINSDTQLSTTAPTTRADGTPLVAGDLYVNLTDQEIFIRNASDAWEQVETGIETDVQETGTEPTQREDGKPLEPGDIWIDNTDSNRPLLHIFDGTAYVRVGTDHETFVGNYSSSEYAW